MGDWLRAILPTVIVIVGLAGVLRGADRFGLLPQPPRSANPGAIVLAHQAWAARAGLPGEIVLLGDSTCLMDVDARALEASLPGQPSVLNLGLIAWLPFQDYAEALEDHAATNSNSVKMVVLLVTPNKLTLDDKDNTREIWRRIRQPGNGRGEPQAESRTLVNWLGGNLLREKLLSHGLVRPLGGVGEGSALFGFPTEVEEYMTERQGSLIELGPAKITRKREAWNMIAFADLEAQCQTFRSKVPSGAKLVVGLTPIASSISSPAELQQRAALLSKWSFYLKADGILTNLPTKFPDALFAANGHLNPVGQKTFTAILARELTPFLKLSK